jgi:hypothetical protein
MKLPHVCICCFAFVVAKILLELKLIQVILNLTYNLIVF